MAALKAAFVAALVALVSLSAGLVLAPPSAAGVNIVVIDLALNGSIESAPPRSGISTSDLLEYRLTITNRSEQTLPSRALALKVFVANDQSRSPTEMEVVRFGAPLLSPLGTCGNGRTREILCTNRRELEPGDDISIVFRHRHPEPVVGRMTFFAELGPNGDGYVEPEGGLSNNGYSGSSYVFAQQPTTTTTTEPTTTTTRPTTTTSTTDPDTTTSTESSTTSSEVTTSTTDTTEPSTSSTTTTSSSTTSTTEATTTSSTTTTTTTTTTSTTTTATTTAPPTTVEATTTTDAAAAGGTDDSLAGPQASLVASNVDSVAGVSAQEQLAEEAAAVLAPDVDDGGPPYLLIIAILAVLALLGGIGLAVYTMVDRDPPLVDIREWDQA